LGSLTANQRRSFARGGFDWVYDHDVTLINASNSGVFRRTLPTTGTMPAAVVRSASNLATALLPAMDGVPPSGTQLVAVGVGPKNTAVPKTMLQAPVFPGCDGKYYGRSVAVFQVYGSAERATLVGVVDSYGRWPDYTIQQYNESLPDGGRQG